MLAFIKPQTETGGNAKAKAPVPDSKKFFASFCKKEALTSLTGAV
jgi:hypothetical protein